MPIVAYNIPYFHLATVVLLHGTKILVKYILELPLSGGGGDGSDGR